MSSTAPSPDSFCRHSFDFLVVGGGTAGLVVASRLSANQHFTVGVLEAGPLAFGEPSIDIPGRFGESLGTKYDWKFETTPQIGLNGRSLPWPRGKLMGGTSALNFMTWNRGCREDYDAWEELGNEGWGWDGILPFFKKSENFIAPKDIVQNSLYFNPESHGSGGPISTVYSDEFGVSHQYWHQTLNNLGVETNKTHFAGSNVGAWTSLTSVGQEKRTRCYSARGYYEPIASRPNLVVLTEALAEEIILEKVDNQWIATGVRFTHSGNEYHVKSSKEIIISAGSVQSPQLLELSGIGSPEILQAGGIDVKVVNPSVGENLQEHMMTMSIFEISPDISTVDDLRSSPELMAKAMEEYTASATGPLTQLPSSVAYLPFSFAIPSSSLTPILQNLPPITSSPSSYTTRRHQALISRFSPGSHLGQIEFNFDTSNYSPYFTSLPGKKYATMMQMLQYPFSRGSINIPPSSAGKKSSAIDKPIIDPKYYQGAGGEIDFKTMVECQKFADKITKTEPLNKIIVGRVFPPPMKEDDFSDFVRNYTITDWHPVGTCGMGPAPSSLSSDVPSREAGKNEEAGVVDSRLRVHGVTGLRVIDASIMPLQISAHLQATVYAIGEKGASLILEDWAGRE